MKKTVLRSYARLIARAGVNIRPEIGRAHV